MNKIIKYFLLIIFLLDFGGQVQVEAKPVPPGSGEGDVPANIVFLIDSSASMRRRINNRDSVQPVNGIIYSSDGSIIAAQTRIFGIVKFDAGGTRDRTWNNNISRYTGDMNHSCQATFTGGNYVTAERNTTARHTWNPRTVRSVSTDNGLITNENLILFSSGDTNINNAGAILGISENGENCRLFLEMGFDIGTFDVGVIDVDGNDEHIIFASGSAFGTNNGVFRTFNIDRGELGPLQNFGTDWDTGGIMGRTWRSAVAVNSDKEPTFYYLARNDIFGYALARIAGSGNFEITDTATPTRRYRATANRNQVDTRLAAACALDFDPDDDSIAYVVSSRRNVLQKVQFTTDTDFTILERAGTGRRVRRMNTAAPGELNANSVRFNRPCSVHVTSTRILVGSASGSTIDVFDEDKFNATDANDAWLLQMGGGFMSRWTGVKRAIAAILSDTSLTTGANFGYGHWNAGEHGGNRDAALGGRRCHRGLDTCNYWTGWTDGVDSDGNQSHIHGRSTQCNRDHCLNVAPSAEGYKKILVELMPQGLAWGTDAKAFSQMGREYFELGGDTNPGHPYDRTSDCQLNYIIVIGDGEMMNVNEAVTDIAALRNMENPIKTIFVAYGDGISARGMTRFDTLAVAGSCEGGISGDDNGCEATIEALTPGDLKSEITARIRQILAERLSFTAPSITANVQEGGSLYQAQFEYQQFGEWKGTILRKTLLPSGHVDHIITEVGPNWNAADEVLAQSTGAGLADSRNIWTTLEDASYINNWDNFTVANEADISDLFELLDYTIPDYHNTSSHCANVGDDGSDDDADGLINFVKGSDYFDYDGDCDVLDQDGVDEVRDHVLGDIYHSQLIEIGPPDASTDFTSTNEESYFRSKNNYAGFAAKHAGRQNIVYAGSNSGLLHAFRAKFNEFGRGGRELWAFMPPFIVGQLPTIISPTLDGTVNLAKGRSDGGSNSIFGVDGSPVVHDVFMRGYDGNNSCNYNATPDWHTILFIPYGRGGAGFSVLDVTYPIVSDSQGPCHMFSVYNDAINNVVHTADRDGRIKSRTYNQASYSVGESLEAIQADDNFQTARDDDGWPDDTDTTTAQDLISECQKNADGTGDPALTTDFHVAGTASCYTGTTFTFEMGRMDTKSGDDNTIPKHVLKVTERIGGVVTTIDYDKAEYVNEQVVITLNNEKVYNPRGPGIVTVGGTDITLAATNDFSVSTTCVADRGIPKKYDYSQLGETWSAPRIFRIPAIDEVTGDLIDNIDSDKYVAIFGAGMGNVSLCAGNAFFIVDLEAGLEQMNLTSNEDEGPGQIFGAQVNAGPITIIDADPDGIHTVDGHEDTDNASDIGNALPSSAVVITPETAFNIPWRGAMVYINDLEGKITKINLTNQTEHNAKMFDQTTLFTLGATETNARHSFFQMDAAIGGSRGEFWLFGGTGNFNDIGGVHRRMDNILYGVKDVDYPYFKHLNEVTIPKGGSGGDFLSKAHKGANDAMSIDAAEDCTPVTGSRDFDKCPILAEFAWKIHLDTIDLIDPKRRNADGTPETNHRFRKISAAPTVFNGNVYFPIYEPPGGADRCNIGNAYICVADDECGTNNSHLLKKGSPPSGTDCHYVREGILSELVIFGDKLFANVAGPKEDARTLYSVLAASGEVSSSRGSWREVGF